MLSCPIYLFETCILLPVQSVVVTGCEGFIGRRVRQALSRSGLRVISVDTKPLASSPDCIQCDITQRDQLQKAFVGPTVSIVVHLASCLRTLSIQNPRRATEVNIVGTSNVLEAAAKAGVRRVVYASSSSIYGSTSSGQDVSEETPTAPEDLYGASKKYAELLCDAYARNHGINFAAIRIPVVIGPGATGTSSPWRSEIFEKLPGGQRWTISIPFRRDEILTLVHVEDVANEIAHLVCAESWEFSCYNAPAEIWNLKDLEKEVLSINQNLKLHFGEAVVAGFARRMISRRFREEFHFAPVPLKTRFREAARHD